MHARMIRSIAVGASLLVSMASAAEAASCAKTSEAAALRTRMLQTELMVAALSCNQKDEYNAFVVQYRPELKQNGTTLQSYFRRSYGRRGTDELNRFTTKLANEASKRSLGDVRSFCADAAQTFSALKSLPTVRFATFVAERPTADSHGMEVCGGKAVVREAALTTGKAKSTATVTKAKSSANKKTTTTKVAAKAAPDKTTKTATKAAPSKTTTKTAKAAAPGAAKTVKATPAMLTENIDTAAKPKN